MHHASNGTSPECWSYSTPTERGAPFLFLGWVAERFPKLVREIAAAGHEIGCHSYAHKRLNVLTPEQFRLDLKKATSLLQDQVQHPIDCFRAPSFSIVRNTMWAFEILAEQGFTVDSSSFRSSRPVWGSGRGSVFALAEYGRPSHFRVSSIDIAIPKHELGGRGRRILAFIPLRCHLLGYPSHQRRGQAARDGLLSSLGNRSGQPRIRAGLRSTLRHYVNLFTMEQKIEHLLQDFRFTTLSDACSRQEAYHKEQIDTQISPRVTKTAAGAAHG